MSYGAAPSIFDDPNETPTARLTRLAKQYQQNYAKPPLTAEEVAATSTASLNPAPSGSIFERGIDYVRGDQSASPGRRMTADALQAANEYLNPLQSAYDAGTRGAQGDYTGAALAAIGAVPGFRTEAKAAEQLAEAAPKLLSPSGKVLTPAAAKRADEIAAATAGPALLESRVSQRVPYAAGTPADVGSTKDLRIDVDTMRKDPEYWDKATNAQLTVDPKTGEPVMTVVKGEPGPQARGPLTDVIPEKVATSKDPEERYQAARFIMMDNLNRLYERMNPALRAEATKWYPGGNKIIGDLAGETGFSKEAVAGTMAALSPQKDWFQNLSMGERLTHTAAEAPRITEDVVRSLAERGSQEYRKFAKELKPYIGKRWDEIEDTRHAAIAAVAHDVHTRDQTVPIFSPSGKQMGLASKKSGEPSKLAWTNLGNVEKAVVSLRSGGDLGVISDAVGGAHKVRNFYNNLIAPRGPWNDFTNDTHNIAAALLRPLTGADALVQVGLGNAGPKSALLGAKGTYGMFADVGRDLAARYGVLPFEVQSPTWEAVRGLFPASAKSGAKATVNAIWDDFRKGNIGFKEAQDRVFSHAEQKMKGDVNRVPWRD